VIAHAVNHLWQSTLFAAVIALLAVALRRNGAHVRYWLWFGASIKFFVPFALFVGLGALAASPSSALPASRLAPGAVTVAVDRVAQPFALDLPDGLVTRDTGREFIAAAAASIWVLGVVAIAIMRLRGWRRVRRAIAASAAIELSGARGTVTARSAPGLLEPGVVGLWRPVLLVPANIAACLTPSQLDAVVAHELCHLRRRDTLTSAFHMLVETTFWFHPLVWWIGARLVDERERACDEAVLGLGLEPRDYAEGILNVCRLYVESPLACVPGVSGASIKQRIEAIMSHRSGVGLNLSRRVALAVAAVAALTAPVLAGLITAPLHQEPKFEVASIRPCESGPVVAGGRGGGGGPVFSPGYFVFNCGTLEQLIQAAYINNGEPLLNDAGRPGPYQDETAAFPPRLRGGPDWARTEKYTIEAKAEISTGRTGRDAQPERKIMMGPMLRALLEERFQLKLHRDVQNDIPMYALTVAKGGLKIQPVGPDGGCTPADLSQRSPISLQEEIQLVRRGGKPYCGHGIMGGPVGSAWALVLNGQPMEGVARALSGQLDRTVLDKTGVEGKFIIYLEYAPDEHVNAAMIRAFGQTRGDTPAAASDPSGPTLFAALEKIGLRIETAKGPKGYIVIDRAERPTIGGR